jgi:transcriptional regulator with XRE-family HTH domain
MTMETMGTRIAELRKRKGVTQDQLAEQMGVSCQAVSKWENDLSCPDIALLAPLADYFGVTTDELLRGKSAQLVRVVPEGERKDLSQMMFKILVNSAEGDVVRINLPMSLVKLGLEIGKQVPQISGNDALKNIDFESILLMVESGVIGRLVEVKSQDGTEVEIVVE